MKIFTFAPFLLLILSASHFAQEPESPQGKLRVSTLEEIKSEFVTVPCKNDDRLGAVKALFERMGADPAEISVEKYKKAENVVIRKPAASVNSSAEKIIIGAHYDKTERGCGAVDNWTGIVTIAHIYRTMKDYLPNKNIVFVAFGQEEKGLYGSSAMVDAIEKEKRAEYCAMINIDSLGLNAPFAADNMSSSKLINFAQSLAKEMNIPFSRERLPGADSDSSSFVQKKIPAVSILGLNKDWRTVLHTDNDQVTKVKIDHVYLGYRLALALLIRIDQASCQAFR